MKKILILSILTLVMSSCACVIAQIPPQYVQVGADCQAVLPNYLPMVVVNDNCEVKSVVQTPAPGYVLNAVNQTVEVKIRATDSFNNFTEVSFTVTAKDTIPPTIEPTGDLIADAWEKIDSMYDRADRMLAEQEAFFDANFDWSAIPVELQTKDQYNKKLLVTWTSPGHATKGYGTRAFTFVSPNDTFLVK